MSKNNVLDLKSRETGVDSLAVLLRTRTRQLILQAVVAEMQELLASHEDQCLTEDRIRVVRNDYQPSERYRHIFSQCEKISNLHSVKRFHGPKGIIVVVPVASCCLFSIAPLISGLAGLPGCDYS